MSNLVTPDCLSFKQRTRDDNELGKLLHAILLPPTKYQASAFSSIAQRRKPTYSEKPVGIICRHQVSCPEAVSCCYNWTKKIYNKLNLLIGVFTFFCGIDKHVREAIHCLFRQQANLFEKNTFFTSLAIDFLQHINFPIFCVIYCDWYLSSW